MRRCPGRGGGGEGWGRGPDGPPWVLTGPRWPSPGRWSSLGSPHSGGWSSRLSPFQATTPRPCPSSGPPSAASVPGHVVSTPSPPSGAQTRWRGGLSWAWVPAFLGQTLSQGPRILGRVCARAGRRVGGGPLALKAEVAPGRRCWEEEGAPGLGLRSCRREERRGEGQRFGGGSRASFPALGAGLPGPGRGL